MFPAPPAAPGNLILVPSNPTLTLEWDRPTNAPAPVQVTYIVDINSTDPNIDMNSRNLTTETFLSVHFLEVLLARGQCVMYEFSVTGQNLAGVGETATIIDTVPICELSWCDYCRCTCVCILLYCPKCAVLVSMSPF